MTVAKMAECATEGGSNRCYCGTAQAGGMAIPRGYINDCGQNGRMLINNVSIL